MVMKLPKAGWPLCDFAAQCPAVVSGCIEVNKMCQHGWPRCVGIELAICVTLTVKPSHQDGQCSAWNRTVYRLCSLTFHFLFTHLCWGYRLIMLENYCWNSISSSAVTAPVIVSLSCGGRTIGHPCTPLPIVHRPSLRPGLFCWNTTHPP